MVIDLNLDLSSASSCADAACDTAKSAASLALNAANDEDILTASSAALSCAAIDAAPIIPFSCAASALGVTPAAAFAAAAVSPAAFATAAAIADAAEDEVVLSEVVDPLGLTSPGVATHSPV